VQIADLDEAHIRGNLVAGLEHHDVTRAPESRAAMRQRSPSRTTRHSCTIMLRSASSAPSALPSCTKPRMALSSTTEKITIVSGSMWLPKAVSTPVTSAVTIRMITIGSLN
jgi:hypothetical protein